jgi:hypothetical protein
MNNLTLSTATLMIMSINIYGDSLSNSLESVQTVFEGPAAQETTQQLIKVRSVRNILGEYDLMEHTSWENMILWNIQKVNLGQDILHFQKMVHHVQVPMHLEVTITLTLKDGMD